MRFEIPPDMMERLPKVIPVTDMANNQAVWEATVNGVAITIVGGLENSMPVLRQVPINFPNEGKTGVALIVSETGDLIASAIRDELGHPKEVKELPEGSHTFRLDPNPGVEAVAKHLWREHVEGCRHPEGCSYTQAKALEDARTSLNIYQDTLREFAVKNGQPEENDD